MEAYLPRKFYKPEAKKLSGRPPLSKPYPKKDTDDAFTKHIRKQDLTQESPYWRDKIYDSIFRKSFISEKQGIWILHAVKGMKCTLIPIQEYYGKDLTLINMTHPIIKDMNVSNNSIKNEIIKRRSAYFIE